MANVRKASPGKVAEEQMYEASKLLALAANNVRKDMSIPMQVASVVAVVADNLATMATNMCDRLRHDRTGYGPAPTKVWLIKNRGDDEAPTSAYPTLERARDVVEQRDPGGVWDKSDSHGEIHYYLPAGSTKKQRSEWLAYIVPLEVQK